MRPLTEIVPGLRPAALSSLVFSFFVACSLVLATMADADAKKRKRAKPNNKYAAYVIDAKTGKVLHARNANARRYPASLTKMMTLYLMFEDLDSGKIKKSSRIRMSKYAASRVPSKLGVRAGRSVSVDQAILALVTKSANDVATAVAENLEGSEPAFARRMTRTARRLGMSKTTFKNANGLTHRGQITTAADMAKLGLALREHFPRHYRYFKTRVFKYGKRRMGNHNKLLGRVRGVDGIKTGYTRASGFNLVSSVSHKGRKIVAVVMGGRSGGSRNAQMRRLIARYLPKASRGKAKRLIAKRTIRRNSPVAVATLVLPKRNAPTPKFAPASTDLVVARIQTAHANSATRSEDVAKVERQLVAMRKKLTPTPINRPVRDPALDANVVVASTKKAKAPRGWQIQISAAESEAKAQQLLAKARSKTRSVLGSKRTFTQPVNANGTTLYRARFVGFRSKKSAYRACRALKRKRFNCIALKV